MADPRTYDDVPTGMTGREVAGLIITLIGAAALIAGAAAYDWRAGLATAGAIALVLGVLLGMG